MAKKVSQGTQRAPDKEKNVLEIVWKAAHMPGTAGAKIFFVGPYGRRVSFVSQQRRALNTVWALKQRNIIGEGAKDVKVAVVGAGLAGITAAVALRAYGAHVTLYEAMPSALLTQISTYHRMVHPTVNFWPSIELEASTLLPFFDWTSNRCAEVIGDIEDEWKKVFLKKITRKFFNTRAERIQYIKTRRQIQIKSFGIHDDSSKVESHKILYYDAVIVATGFGEETVVKRSRGGTYWTEDRLEIERDRPKNKLFIVSGAGDGGLIDSLRLIHSKFDQGKLPLRIIAALLGSGFDTELDAIEQEAAEIQDRSKQAQFLKDKYFDLVPKLPDQFREMMRDSLCNKGKLTIVGREKWPFTSEAAPIHKLIIAYALRYRHIRYKQGDIDEKKQKDIDIKQRKLAITLPNKKTEYLPCDFYVARHGAVPPLNELVKDLDVRQLRQNQRIVADWLDLVEYDPAMLKLQFPEYPIWDTGNDDFVKQRIRLAEKYLRRVYDAGVKYEHVKAEDIPSPIRMKRPELTGDAKRRIPVYVVERQLGGGELINEFGLVDTNLFGIPLMTTTVRNALAYGGAVRSLNPKTSNTLRSGQLITSDPNGNVVGTMGAIVTKANEDGLFGITAAHIAGGAVPIFAHGDTTPIGHGLGAERSTAIEGDQDFELRIALFKINDPKKVSEKINWKRGKLRFIRPIDGIGQTVIKSGAATGLTRGTVVSISGKIRMPDWMTKRPIIYQNVIEVEPETGDPYFAQPGDSGALVITEAGGVLGVVIGGYDRKAVVAPLYGLAVREQLRLAGQGAVIVDQEAEEEERIIAKIREMFDQIQQNPKRWHEHLASWREFLSQYFTDQHRRFGQAHMESVQDSFAIRLLSIVGMKNFAGGIGKLLFMKDAPGPVPRDNWVLRATIERQKILEVDEQARRLRLANGLGPWYRFDEDAPIVQWIDIDKDVEQQSSASTVSAADLCLGVNSFPQ